MRGSAFARCFKNIFENIIQVWAMGRQPTEIIGLRSLSYLGVFLDNVLCKYPVKFVKKNNQLIMTRGSFISLLGRGS